MKVGDMIAWTNYIKHPPLQHCGIIVNYCEARDEFQVLCEGKIVEWLRWQCSSYEVK